VAETTTAKQNNWRSLSTPPRLVGTRILQWVLLVQLILH